MNENYKTDLINVFGSEEVNEQLNKIFLPSNNIDIDCLTNNSTEIITNAAKKIVPLRKLKNKRNMTKMNAAPRNRWFDKDCRRIKKEVKSLGKLLSAQPDNPFIRYLFFSKKKEYKKLIRKLKRNFHDSLLDKISILADSNPREFWDLVNSHQVKSVWCFQRNTA